MSFQRRAYDMDLGRRDHTRWLGSSGRYSTRLTLPTTGLLAAYDARVGVTNVAECGPGKVLAGLVKRCADGLNGIALCDAASIEANLNLE